MQPVASYTTPCLPTGASLPAWFYSLFTWTKKWEKKQQKFDNLGKKLEQILLFFPTNGA